MQIAKPGIDLIKEFESCKLQAYRCPANICTVGWGHTGADVHDGLVITQQKADELLIADLQKFCSRVMSLAPKCTQNQFDALVSFAYNCGPGNLASSTLLKKHNAGDYDHAALEFGKWNKASGKILAGLTRRRAAEAALYAAK